ncbi:hypothetical protein SETIT_3G380600v2 [Setaria italica]|uniref:Uncharacterized protein n=1 Tax=Setaria italica TaxID=4555 RepID=A0A368QN37_SETIT|nr:hypothetical protein SETIT_3G380600v2 [Setaria italica]
MAWSSPKPATALLLLHQLRQRAPATVVAPAAPLRRRRHLSSSTSSSTTTHTRQQREDGSGGKGSVVENPPPGMAHLPEDAPRQTPPRLGEPECRTSRGRPCRRGGMPDTASAPDVAVPPVSPDGSNV